MTCQDCLATHSEYLDGVLPEEQRERVAVHLARCPACARYDRVLRRGLDLVRAMPELDASPDFEQRLQHGIFHVRDERPVRPRLSSTSGAALLAVAGLVSLVVWSPLTETAPPAFETVSAESLLNASDAEPIGGDDPWFVGAPPVYQNPDAPPSLALAFPGPYSPLVVEPPLRAGGLHLTSFRLE